MKKLLIIINISILFSSISFSQTTYLLNSANDGLIVNTCDAILYDDGGATGDYSNNQHYEITFHSNNGSCIRAILQSYYIEYGYDSLYIYDGIGSTNPANLIGQIITDYPVSTINRTGNAYYAQSGYITIRFFSDGATVKSGFALKIDCPSNCIAPPISGNTPAGDSCDVSTPICDFNGYYGNTSTAYPTDHQEIDYYHSGIFCGGINNNSWLSFIADSTSAILDVWVKNCQGSSLSGNPVKGVQMQVYETDCSNGNFTPVSNCWSPSEEINGQIVAYGLTVGNEYKLMIDGYASDNCEYVFAASSGLIVADAGHDKTICEGETTSLTASGGTNVVWTSTPSDPSLLGQENNFNINVSPSQTTTYTATVTGLNSNCPGIADVVVFVNSADASFSGLANDYCVNDGTPVSLSGNYPTGVFSGNGVSGSSFTPSMAGAGTQLVTYTFNYSVVTAFSDDFDPTPNAGWTHGYDIINASGTHSKGDSWQTGSPTGGYGQNASTQNPDPIIDHTSTNNDNNVYGEGLGNTTSTSHSDIELGGYYHNSREWLKSPAIDCSNLSNTVLSFWRYANLETSYDEAYVYISNDGTTWHNLGEPLYPTDDHWTQRIINISQYADGHSTVYIKWTSESDNYTTYSGWNIDDVTITGVQPGGSCVSTEVQSTNVNSLPTTNFNAPNPTCSNSSSTITYTGSAGSGATYTWNFGGGNIISGSGQGPYVISWPTVQNYNVSLQVTENGCTSTVNTQVVSVPQAITATTNSTNADCGSSNGTASVSASGGSGSYSYNWSSGSTSSSATGLAGGTYTVTVTDIPNGCQTIATAVVSENGGPTISSITNQDVSCFGGNNGQATVNVTGGPYTYNWSNGQSTQTISNLTAGTYNVTVSSAGCSSTGSIIISQPNDITIVSVIDSIDCYNQSNGSISISVNGGTPSYSYNWTGGSTSQNLTNLPSGTYVLTVTDDSSCVKTQTYDLYNPSQLIVSETIDSVSCFDLSDGNIYISANGGTGNLTYSWGAGETTSYLSNIQAGTYYLTVTDENNCTNTSSYIVSQPDEIQINETHQDEQCFNDSSGYINLSVTGGVGGFSYIWDNSQTSQNINALSGGTYKVTVTDANHCTKSLSVSINSADSIYMTSNSNFINCYGANTGYINVNAFGGAGNFKYNWSNGDTTQNIVNIFAGDYIVTVVDNNNCNFIDTINISQNSEITLNYDTTQILCFGDKNGNIEINVSGGVPPYTYIPASSFHNIQSGNYAVTVLDSNNCAIYDTIYLSQPNEINIIDSINHDNDFAQVIAEGGSGNYTYQWSTGETTDIIHNLTTGVLYVTVTDKNSCAKIDTIEIISTGLKIPSAITPNDDGFNDTWNILGIERYDDVSIEIYNRWGGLVYSFSGTGIEYTDKKIQWDGKYNGKDLPTSSYVYILKLNKTEQYNGSVTIIK